MNVQGPKRKDHYWILGPEMKVQKVIISIENLKHFKYQGMELIYRFDNPSKRHNITLGKADLWRILNSYVDNE
jgi:hypothetical protein